MGLSAEEQAGCQGGGPLLCVWRAAQCNPLPPGREGLTVSRCLAPPSPMVLPLPGLPRQSRRNGVTAGATGLATGACARVTFLQAERILDRIPFGPPLQ